MRAERLVHPREATGFGLAVTPQDFHPGIKGKFIVDLRDAATGAQLRYFEQENVITRDAGILLASLCKGDPVNALGVTMLAVGTGATGNILAPDAPQDTQRKLTTELARKAFATKQYRNSSGVAVSFRTNVVDFTATFTEAEAVGALNEMALVSPANNNPAITNPLPAGAYDATVDVTGKDLLLNYSTYGVVVKQNTMVLNITWRVTF